MGWKRSCEIPFYWALPFPACGGKKKNPLSKSICLGNLLPLRSNKDICVKELCNVHATDCMSPVNSVWSCALGGSHEWACSVSHSLVGDELVTGSKAATGKLCRLVSSNSGFSAPDDAQWTRIPHAVERFDPQSLLCSAEHLSSGTGQWGAHENFQTFWAPHVSLLVTEKNKTYSPIQWMA